MSSYITTTIEALDARLAELDAERARIVEARSYLTGEAERPRRGRPPVERAQVEGKRLRAVRSKQAV